MNIKKIQTFTKSKKDRLIYKSPSGFEILIWSIVGLLVLLMVLSENFNIEFNGNLMQGDNLFFLLFIIVLTLTVFFYMLRIRRNLLMFENLKKVNDNYEIKQYVEFDDEKVSIGVVDHYVKVSYAAIINSYLSKDKNFLVLDISVCLIKLNLKYFNDDEEKLIKQKLGIDKSKKEIFLFKLISLRSIILIVFIIIIWCSFAENLISLYNFFSG